MSPHSFVFICGLHKSGTSLLHRCLRTHPLISAFKNTGAPRDEGQYLQSVYPLASAYGGPGRFGFNPGSHRTESSSLMSERNRHRLLAEWARHWDLSRPILLEKSPPNLLMTRFLQEMFPRSYFIVVLRHPIATSFATRKWNRRPMRSLVRHWLECHEKFIADSCYIRRSFVLKYEAFVENPELQLQRILSFLEVAELPVAKENRFSADVSSLDIRSDLNARYYEMWRRRARNPLSRPFVNATIRAFENRVRRFAYSLSEPEELREPCDWEDLPPR